MQNSFPNFDLKNSKKENLIRVNTPKLRIFLATSQNQKSYVSLLYHTITFYKLLGVDFLFF